VYKISSEKTNFTDILAVKILPTKLFADDEIRRKNFVREKNICEKLDHENICRLISFCSDSKYYYMIQEYCDRGNLKELIKEKSKNKIHKCLSEKEALPIMKQIIKCF